MTYQGRHLFLDACLAEGADVMFGNPGTSEVPILDALLDRPAIRYILCQHEAVAVTAADAFARLRGQVGLVNLHIGPGLGNAIGSLYNAYERGSPLVVTCGQTDTRMRLREPMTSHDLVAMATPVTKWAVQVECIEELPLAMARAFKSARDTPTGPVFVSLPTNIMDAPTTLRPLARSRIAVRNRPAADAIAHAVDMLTAARSPAIVVGDGVAREDAGAALAALAQALGAPVHACTLPAHMNLPFAHPLFVDRVPITADLIARHLAQYDALLLVGGDFFEEAFYAEGPYFPAGAAIIQIDSDLAQIGRNFSVDCGIYASLPEALTDLRDVMERDAGPMAAARAKQRFDTHIDRKRQEREAHRDQIAADRGTGRLTPLLALDTIARRAPPDAHIAAEVHLATNSLMRCLSFTDPRQYLSARAGGIGQAFPSGIGAKLACPDRPVIAISGDGSALYTPQALWTAAHEELAIVFIVLNNRAYDILKMGMNWYRRAAGIDPARPVPLFDLTPPEIDFVSLARGFGVDGVRVGTVEALEEAMSDGLAAGRPYLIDAVVA